MERSLRERPVPLGGGVDAQPFRRKIHTRGRHPLATPPGPAFMTAIIIRLPPRLRLVSATSFDTSEVEVIKKELEEIEEREKESDDET